MTLIIGCGGTGENVLKRFLRNEDIRQSDSEEYYTSFGRIKGIWLEADDSSATNPKQDFFTDIDQGAKYPNYYIFIKAIDEDLKLKLKDYTNLAKQSGYTRDLDILNMVFETIDYDENLQENGENPISKGMYETIKGSLAAGEKEVREKHDTLLFIVGLGGGTGSGIINPVSEYFRGKKHLLTLVLGVLTGIKMETREDEKIGDEKNWKDGQKAEYKKRCFSAMLTLNNLLAARNVDAVILVDNDGKVLGDKRREGKNEVIFKSFLPMLDQRLLMEELPGGTLKNEFKEGLDFPPILVPCYSEMNKLDFKHAIENRLINCDPQKADRAYVFTRGMLLDEKEIRERVGEQIWDGWKTWDDEEKVKRVDVWRKYGNFSKPEVLILLRNPYGKSPNLEGIESKWLKMIEYAKEYANEHVNDDKFLEAFNNEKKHNGWTAREMMIHFIKGREVDGKNVKKGLVGILNEVGNRINNGAEPPFFTEEAKIFGEYSTKGKSNEKKTNTSEKFKNIDKNQLIELITNDRDVKDAIQNTSKKT